MISAAVMAHPRRTDMVVDLKRRLDRPVPVVWDEVNDRHDTGIRALEAFDPTCSHHLVIQDDVLPAPDLLAGVEMALEHVPADVPVSFYIGRVKPFGRAVEAAVRRCPSDVSWLIMDGVYWGPAVAVPTGEIPEIAEWWRTRRAERITNYDRRLSFWYQQHNRRCWYSWPSLVDHRGDDSLVSGHTAERRAHRFCDGSALDVDWTGPAVSMSRTGRLDEQRQRLAAR